MFEVLKLAAERFGWTIPMDRVDEMVAEAVSRICRRSARSVSTRGLHYGGQTRAAAMSTCGGFGRLVGDQWSSLETVPPAGSRLVMAWIWVAGTGIGGVFEEPAVGGFAVRAAEG
jgi:hypothetical protein